MNWFVATSSWLLTAKDLPLRSQLKCCDNDGGFSLEFEAQVPFKKLVKTFTGQIILNFFVLFIELGEEI